MNIKYANIRDISYHIVDLTLSYILSALATIVVMYALNSRVGKFQILFMYNNIFYSFYAIYYMFAILIQSQMSMHVNNIKHGVVFYILPTFISRIYCSINTISAMRKAIKVLCLLFQLGFMLIATGIIMMFTYLLLSILLLADVEADTVLSLLRYLNMIIILVNITMLMSEEYIYTFIAAYRLSIHYVVYCVFLSKINGTKIINP